MVRQAHHEAEKTDLILSSSKDGPNWSEVVSFETWLLFAGAAFIIGIIPGPGVTTIVGHALAGGPKQALAAVFGAALGSAISMSLSLAGAGALLAASDVAFGILKWAGSIYLIGLGLFTIRSTFGAEKRKALAKAAGSVKPRHMSFWGTAMVTLFNPKTLVFFVAFVPGFIAQDAAFLPQAMLLVVTYSIVVLATDTAYALAASGAAGLFKGERFQRWAKRAGGGSLIGAGLVTAASRSN